MPIVGDSLRSILRTGRDSLRSSDREELRENADFDAFCLLQNVYGVSREQYSLHADTVPTASLFPRYKELLNRRLAGEPLQYLLGEWEFMGLPFSVGKGVLIPRPETELLAETVLEALRNTPSPRVLELCGGSGCLAVSIGHERPDAVITTVELSREALHYLRENIERNHCRNITVVGGNALEPIPALAGQTFDAVLSNPPYIAANELPNLQKEVQWEPAMALDGGEDGLLFYRAFLRIYPSFIQPGGLIAFEIGEDQGSSVSELMQRSGLQEIAVLQDYASLPRVVTGRV